MDTIHLRASGEAALAAALPWLRGVDASGATCWLVASHHHALDCIGPLETTSALVDPETGDVVSPAVIDSGFHANLRVLPAHPAAAAITSACAPFIVVPSEPRRAFA